MSTISIFGRLTGDPECKALQSGQLVTHFNLADNHGKDDQGKDKVSFFRVSAFGKAAEMIGNSCKKGHRLFVSGRFESRQYTNNSGQAATSLEVTLSEFQFGEIKADVQPQQAAAPVQNYAPQPQGYPQPQPQYVPQPGYGQPMQAPPAARPQQNYPPPYQGQPAPGYQPQQLPPQGYPPQGYPQPQQHMVPASDKPF